MIIKRFFVAKFKRKQPFLFFLYFLPPRIKNALSQVIGLSHQVSFYKSSSLPVLSAAASSMTKLGYMDGGLFESWMHK